MPAMAPEERGRIYTQVIALSPIPPSYPNTSFFSSSLNSRKIKSLSVLEHDNSSDCFLLLRDLQGLRFEDESNLEKGLILPYEGIAYFKI